MTRIGMAYSVALLLVRALSRRRRGGPRVAWAGKRAPARPNCCPPPRVGASGSVSMRGVSARSELWARLLLVPPSHSSARSCASLKAAAVARPRGCETGDTVVRPVARPAGLARTRPAAGLRGRVQGRRGRLDSRPLSVWLRYQLSSLAVARLRDRVVARPPRGHAVERPTDHAVARLRGRPRGRAVANLAIMMQFSLEQRDALSCFTSRRWSM